jgi:hypothetical protein
MVILSFAVHPYQRVASSFGYSQPEAGRHLVENREVAIKFI